MTKQAKPKGTLEQILELHNLFFLPNLVRHHGAAFFFSLSLSPFKSYSNMFNSTFRFLVNINNSGYFEMHLLHCF